MPQDVVFSLGYILQEVKSGIASAKQQEAQWGQRSRPRHFYRPATETLMRSYSAIILPLVVVASVSAHHGHSDYHTMKQWMMDKAFASCLGEENLKTWQAEKKKFEAECAGEDAPELDLPFFRSPYRVTS
eukprot:maker-scaffold77_size404793-snap-gene-3.38 protein:Tk04794 transcript:maker-scaffold77_size404793-snap-gene-3.38-mRNA-1 annotation:"ddb1- and cul4-associated factor 12-like protein 2-like"